MYRVGLVIKIQAESFKSSQVKSGVIPAKVEGSVGGSRVHRREGREEWGE